MTKPAEGSEFPYQEKIYVSEYQRRAVTLLARRKRSKRGHNSKSHIFRIALDEYLTNHKDEIEALMRADELAAAVVG